MLYVVLNRHGGRLIYSQRSDFTSDDKKTPSGILCTPDDFFVRTAEELLPVEGKAGNNVSRSLRNLIASDHYPAIKHGIKFAHANIGKTETITTFPYFCAFLLKRYLKEQ